MLSLPALSACGRIRVVRLALAVITTAIVIPTFAVPEGSPLLAEESSPLSPPQAASVPAPPALPPGKTQRAYLDVKVNGVPAGQLLVLLRGDDILVATADLKNAGLHDVKGREEEMPGGTFVSLASLAPAVTYTFDESNLALIVTVDPAHLERSVVDLDGRPHDIVVTRAKFSAYANYAVTGTSTRSLTMSGETNVSVDGALVSSTFVRASNGHFGTGQTSVTLDNVHAARRAVLGMTSLQGDGPFVGSAAIEGASVTRNFDIDPNLVQTQPSELTGVVTTPSTAEIYINGVLSRTEQINPGPFTLSNLPLAGGANTMKVVLKDAFGKVTTIGKPLYVQPALLKKGLVAYSAGVGRLQGYDAQSGGLGYLGFVRAGLSRSFTASAFTDGSSTVRATGAGIATANRFGSFDVNVARSNGVAAAFVSPLLAQPVDPTVPAAAPPPLRTGTSAAGHAESFSYEFSGRHVSGSLSFQRESPFFANLAQPVLGDRALLDRRISLSAPVGKQRVSIVDSRVFYRDRAPLRETVISSAIPIPRLGSLSFGLGRGTEEGRSSPIVRVALNMNVLHGTSINTSSETTASQRSRGMQISRQSPSADGLSYTISQTGDEKTHETTPNAQVSFGTPVGDLQLQSIQAGGAIGTSLSLSGAVAAVPGRVAFTKPIAAGFALVDLDGVRGVRTSVNNRVYGRTDRRGEILVPDLFPYQRNEIAIRGADAPEDVLIDTDKKLIAPSYKSGVVVRFPTKRIRSYVGRLVIASSGGPIVPAYGAIVLGEASAGFGSDIGADGGVYFENVTPATYPARISFSKGTCDFKLTIPKSDVAITKLGTIECAGPLRPAPEK